VFFLSRLSHPTPLSSGHYLNYTNSKHEQDTVKASIDLKDATSIMFSDVKITLYLATGEKYEFRATTAEESREWADAMAAFTPDGFAIDADESVVSGALRRPIRGPIRDPELLTAAVECTEEEGGVVYYK
jgi:hypothetical protein